MPLFHSNAVMAGWAPALHCGATMALCEKFSASRLLEDVRRYGATYLNYVGKPLSYVMATPEQPDDHDNPLRLAFGNEAGDRDIAGFARRFDCTVVDGFGSTENAVVISRIPGTPPGALGVPLEGILVLDPETGQECPRAEFDEDGRVTNPDEATGELVNTTGTGQFAGYYNDEAATAERMRDGMYWSGDLAYRDAGGLRLLRRPDRRLAARRRGEPRGRADRADPGPPPERLRGSGVRRARRVLGRPARGRPRARRRPGPAAPGRRSSAASPTSAPSSGRATCGSSTRSPAPRPTRCSSESCARPPSTTAARCGPGTSEGPPIATVVEERAQRASRNHVGLVIHHVMI